MWVGSANTTARAIRTRFGGSATSKSGPNRPSEAPRQARPAQIDPAGASFWGETGSPDRPGPLISLTERACGPKKVSGRSG